MSEPFVRKFPPLPHPCASSLNGRTDDIFGTLLAIFTVVPIVVDIAGYGIYTLIRHVFLSAFPDAQVVVNDLQKTVSVFISWDSDAVSAKLGSGTTHRVYLPRQCLAKMKVEYREGDDWKGGFRLERACVRDGSVLASEMGRWEEWPLDQVSQPPCTATTWLYVRQNPTVKREAVLERVRIIRDVDCQAAGAGIRCWDRAGAETEIR